MLYADRALWHHSGNLFRRNRRMSYRFQFDRVNSLLLCTMDGRVTKELLRQCYLEIAKHAAALSPRAGIMDLSGITSFQVSPMAVRELASNPPAISDPERPRVLVAGSDYLFGLARMFQMLSDISRPRLSVVRTTKQALDLLGVANPQFEPISGDPFSTARTC